jgi:hypothetical protein
MHIGISIPDQMSEGITDLGTLDDLGFKRDLARGLYLYETRKKYPG